MAKPRKGKAKVKITASGKNVSYGQKGAKVRPNSPKGDSYCSRAYAQLKKFKKAASDPNSPLRLSRKRWKCIGKRSVA